MPNLLNDPSNWTEGVVSPPPSWNGSSYNYDGVSQTSYKLDLTGAVAPGDTIEGAVNFHISALPWLNYVAGGVVVDSVFLDGSTVLFNFAAEMTGDSYLLNADSDTQINPVALAEETGIDIEPMEVDVLIANDDASTTPYNTPVITDVLANDDFNGSPPTVADVVVTIEVQPNSGTVDINPDGSITYTPNPGFSGVDQYEYRITTPDPPQTAFILFNCDVQSLNPFPPGEDQAGVDNLPVWFDLGQVFTIGGVDWSVDFLWDPGNELYIVSNPVTPENGPSCCDGGTGLTITQGANSVDADYAWNCA